MKKTLFWLTEINVLMWLAIFGHAIAFGGSLSLKLMTGLGLAVGAVMQHRVYYETFRKKA